MSYKERLYKSYCSTHIVHRKGKATLDEYRQRAVSYQKQFGSLLPKDRNARIIDIGCGNGSIVWWLQNIGYVNAEGVDVSAEQIAAAQELGVQNVRQLDADACLFNKDSQFDTIILRDVIEHFEKEKIVDLLEKCCSSLHEQGSIILQVPNAESPFGARVRYGDFTHEVSFTSASLSQVLRSVGFTSVDIYPVEQPIRSLRSLFRYTLWKVVQQLYIALITIELGKGRWIVTQNIIACGRKG